MNSRARPAVLTAALLALAIAGCGGGGDDDGGPSVAEGGAKATAPPATTTPALVDPDDNPAKVYDRDETADADFGTVEIVAVQDPRPPKSPFLPSEGTRFVGITFELTGKSKLKYRGFELYGKNDRIYDQVPDPDAFSAGTIDKGETRRGLVVFEVPKAVKSDNLRFHVDAPLGAEDTVEIRLK